MVGDYFIVHIEINICRSKSDKVVPDGGQNEKLTFTITDALLDV